MHRSSRDDLTQQGKQVDEEFLGPTLGRQQWLDLQNGLENFSGVGPLGLLQTLLSQTGVHGQSIAEVDPQFEIRKAGTESISRTEPKRLARFAIYKQGLAVFEGADGDATGLHRDGGVFSR